MIIKPAIVVSAYNRSKPLSRLLQSIARANYEGDAVTLVISIDKSDNTDVLEIARGFNWEYGEKKIVQHAKHLGLKEHILSCGDLTSKYEAVIVLEDDLLVSPYFYSYAKRASTFYKDEKNIAGISLYNYRVSESCFYSFKAVDDGSDVYFMQVASSWGQLCTKEQWQKFRTWFALNPELPINSTIPNYLQQWGKHSWKKHFIHYLIDTNNYFVFPRISLSTNFEEEGTNSVTDNVFQVALQVANCNYNFQHLSNSKSIYDAWFEIHPSVLNAHNNSLSQYDYEVDVYQSKEQYSKEYVLTSKQGDNPILSFSCDLFPLETNIVLQLNGNEINLYKTASNSFSKRKLNLENHLEERNKNQDVGISIVIPILHFNEIELRKTLDSIEQQAYLFYETILIINKNYATETEKIVSYYGFKIIVIVSSYGQIDQLVSVGFNTAQNQILTWISQGNVFRKEALHNTKSIFKSYAGINWICGIEKEAKDKYEYDRLDVFDYRIAPIEIYNRAKKGELSYSTENHFYRKECLNTFHKTEFNLMEFYFHLIDNFQLTVVVKCLLIKSNGSNSFILNQEEAKGLLVKFKPNNSIATRKAKLIDVLLRSKFIGHASYKWFYTSLHNFPDVLRYDFDNETFYFNKH